MGIAACRSVAADLWLAAQAVQRDFQLLTANPKDFADVPGLKMVTIPIP